jgi:F420H(2)-dependent quinone reductase
MSDQSGPSPRVPPRWFIRLAWSFHRGLYRITRGRVGLRRQEGDRWGMLRLTTIGRRSGLERNVILGYLADGPNLITLAMNGWGEGEPAWWFNLQAHPEATVHLVDGPRAVHARAAEGDERTRLWMRWRQVNADLDGYAALRSRETAVVVLEPQTERKPSP